MEILENTIDCLDLNNRTYNALKKHGLIDLKILVTKTESEILKLSEIGYGSLVNLTRQLKKRNLCLGMTIGFEQASYGSEHTPKIQVPNLKLTTLGLSKREQECLDFEEIFDLKTLTTKNEFSLLRIPGFGRNSLLSLKNILGNFGLKFGMGVNDVEWVDSDTTEDFKRISDVFITTIPKVYDASENFGQSIENFIRQYTSTLPRASDRVIFKKRIACKARSIPTLEEVGKELNVTRERIRQLEKKIIVDLVRVIFGGYFLHGKYRIDQYFASGWKNASKSFQDLDEISFPDFINKILTSWDVCFSDIQDHFNFISVVFTGKVKSYLTSQNRTYLAAIYPLKIKCKSILNVKISTLRMRKATKVFMEEGLVTIGDFLESTTPVKTGYSNELVNCLEELKLNRDGLIHWDAYIGLKNFEIIGKDEYECHSDFLGELDGIITRVLELMDLWTHSVDVFRYRTSKHPENRPTLMDAADKILGKPAHGPMISRIQSHFLEKLRLIFLDKDYSFANFWISEGVTKSISSAREIYSLANNDFDQFEYLIRMRWGIKPEPDDISVLWTLIDGYTPDRYFHLQSSEVKKRRKSTRKKELPEMVKLAGFRDVF